MRRADFVIANAVREPYSDLEVIAGARAYAANGAINVAEGDVTAAVAEGVGAALTCRRADVSVIYLNEGSRDREIARRAEHLRIGRRDDLDLVSGGGGERARHLPGEATGRRQH
jgi:NAD(P)H-hydrate repair Nnr-like enzyme with NAD(P)H-hydrate dehydratase domain